MTEAYVELHQQGFAHSIEAWADDRLVGGLYGVSLGGLFFGESMFSLRPDASKVALVHLAQTLTAWDHDLIDCQVDTEHLRRLGAELIPRKEFLVRLEASLRRPTRRGNWELQG
jgi:leucyl/phenylalanyl-tRNA--protein transferase